MAVDDIRRHLLRGKCVEGLALEARERDICLGPENDTGDLMGNPDQFGLLPFSLKPSRLVGAPNNAIT